MCAHLSNLYDKGMMSKCLDYCLDFFKTTADWFIDFNGISICLGYFIPKGLRIVFNVGLDFSLVIS